MSNLSDKEIDRLSREAADSYEPDSSSLSWSRLEHKLVEQMPERPPDGFSFGRINPFIWGPAVLLLAGASFFIIKNSIYSQHSTRTNEPVSQISVMLSGDSSRRDVNSSLEVSPSSAQSTSSSDAKNENQPDHSLAPSSQTGTAKNSDAESVPKLTNARQAEVGSRNRVPLNIPPGNHFTPKDRRSTIPIPSVVTVFGSLAASSGSTTTPGGTPSGLAEKKGSTVIPNRNQVSGATTSGDLLTATSKANAGESPTEAPVYSLPPLAHSAIGLGEVRGNASLLNNPAPSLSTAAPQKSVHINRSLNIGFTFGPDYTDGGGIPNNELSNNIGITLGYYLTNRLSVNTGLTYSNKFYWSPGHGPVRQANLWMRPPINYNPTYAYSPDIEYVNGACNMYELPLTLRYDFANNYRTKFFVNAGLSSYFMLKQTYIYFFHSGGRPLAWKTNMESQSNYWFGVGDLSFGLETEMGKGFSFQAEPFFRIPLQKMGVENLKLYSYGFMISFRYAPVLSRSKK